MTHNVRRSFSLAFSTAITGAIAGALISFSGSSASAGSTERLDIKPENLSFEFGSQDGDFSIPCQHKIANPMTHDWEITCADPERPSTKRTYTLHLVVHIYQREKSPRTTYEILHWLTDHQIKPGDVGRYVGSTVRFRLEDPAALHSLDLGQDFENTNVLRMELRLKK